MHLENEDDVTKTIGPFERAKTNVEKFAWNFMVMYTVVTLMKTYEHLDEIDDDKKMLARITADATLMGVFQLILGKNKDQWD